jgi:putative phosphoesterase
MLSKSTRISSGTAPSRLVGLISDTHGILRPEALRALTGSDVVIHAGDIGRPAILEDLRRVAPVVAVRGNIDKGGWADDLPFTAVVVPGIYVLHDVKALGLDPADAGFRVVVSGHSHRPSRTERGGILYVNPGAAGPRRFRLPVTVARLNVATWEVEFIDVGGGA